MVVAVLLGLILLYQKTLGLIIGGRCRFVPSCSQYAIEAIKMFGPGKGSVLALWRILRCNPLCKGGYDGCEKYKKQH
ncbi:MAG: membrane protein insertion efficiency factor YidD [Anaerohalosphaeraceae bacterium]|nr:membrane protein insertion efficiency factor YidD [Anaerohalosphaeraceae bacterium]